MPRSEIASHKSSHLILLDGVCSVVERLGFFPKSRRGSRVCIQTAHSKRPTGGGILFPSPFWERGQGRGCEAGREIFFDFARVYLNTREQSRASALKPSPQPSPKGRGRSLRTDWSVFIRQAMHL